MSSSMGFLYDFLRVLHRLVRALLVVHPHAHVTAQILNTKAHLLLDERDVETREMSGSQKLSFKMENCS